jgi:predicted RNA methylase
VSPEEAAPRLTGLRKWFPPELGLVTMPAKAARLEKESLYKPHRAREAGEAQFILRHRFRGLRKKLDGLVAPAAVQASVAADTPEQVAVKRGFVEQALGEARPVRLLDVRSGSGEFSLLAAANGASVVAIDPNPANVDTLWRAAAATKADILPLVVDIARPTPSVGWRARENPGFLERAENHFDCVLMQGSLHETMVGDQVPLPEILDLAASLTSKWLVIEYVGPEDVLFRKLTRGREELYRWYSRKAFEECVARAFETVRTVDIPQSHRAMYLLRKI